MNYILLLALTDRYRVLKIQAEGFWEMSIGAWELSVVSRTTVSWYVGDVCMLASRKLGRLARPVTYSRLSSSRRCKRKALRLIVRWYIDCEMITGELSGLFFFTSSYLNRLYLVSSCKLALAIYQDYSCAHVYMRICSICTQIASCGPHYRYIYIYIYIIYMCRGGGVSKRPACNANSNKWSP